MGSALVMERDPGTLETLEQAIRALGLEVVRASDPSEALARLEGGAFDVGFFEDELAYVGEPSLMQELRRRGITMPVFAISRDTPGSHLKYAVKKKITYTLASDPTDLFAQAADAVVEKSMYGKLYMGIDRSTYLIGKDGKVAQIWRKVKVKDHAAEVLAAAKAL
jgi:CheY-like chemotaxis protein